MKFGEAWSGILANQKMSFLDMTTRLEITGVGRKVASKSAVSRGGASSSLANFSRRFSGDWGLRRRRGMAWTSTEIQGIHDDGL